MQWLSVFGVFSLATLLFRRRAAAAPVLTSPGPAGWYGRYWRNRVPPGWPAHAGTRDSDAFLPALDAAWPAQVAKVEQEWRRLNPSMSVAAARDEVAASAGVVYGTLVRLAEHESGGQLYRPANSFNDLPADRRGDTPRISASGAWQFNQGALERLTRTFRIGGTEVHGPLLSEAATARDVHHISAEAQFVPIAHYFLVAMFASRRGKSPVRAIWLMHSGPANLSAYVAGNISSREREKARFLDYEELVVSIFTQQPDRSSGVERLRQTDFHA